MAQLGDDDYCDDDIHKQGHAACSMLPKSISIAKRNEMRGG
jgi:hypothetical protein